MANDGDDALLTTLELAELRKVPPGRLRKERVRGDGPPFIKDGFLVRYRYGDYREWLAKRRLQSTSEPVAA